MKNKKDTKASTETLERMKKLRTDNEAGKLGDEGGNDKKESANLKVGAGSPEKAEESNPGHIKGNSELEHKQVHPVNRHTLTNDTAYFLHHPQIKPHGPSMPPVKPRGK